MFKFQFIILLFCSTSFVVAQETLLQNDTLIITHASRHYHNNQQTIDFSHSLIRDFYLRKRPVFALVQNPLDQDPLWYATPLEYMTQTFYSHAGEHQLFISNIPAQEIRIYVIGGYLSACLGRTVSELISSMVKSSPGPQKLIINLPMKGIFTGFLLDQYGQLVPGTPYLESILDDSIKGINFLQVWQSLSLSRKAWFLEQTLEIALFQKSSLRDHDLSLVDIEVYVGQQYFSFREEKNNKASKTIRLNFFEK